MLRGSPKSEEGRDDDETQHRVTLTRGFWFADLKSGDGFGGRAAGLGQQLVAVVDAEGMVGGLDGQGSSSVDDSDVNALPCSGYGAAAADPTFDLDGFGCWRGWWSGPWRC